MLDLLIRDETWRFLKRNHEDNALTVPRQHECGDTPQESQGEQK